MFEPPSPRLRWRYSFTPTVPEGFCNLACRQQGVCVVCEMKTNNVNRRENVQVDGDELLVDPTKSTRRDTVNMVLFSTAPTEAGGALSVAGKNDTLKKFDDISVPKRSQKGLVRR